MLYTKDMYNNIMLDPFKSGHTDLTIITGYSNPAMVSRHMADINDKKFNINLLIGMGISKLDRNAYIKLEKMYGESFNCFIMPKNKKVHSKLYRWLNINEDVEVYLGSANYSQNGLTKENQKELLYKINEQFIESVNSYIKSSFSKAIPVIEIDDSELLKVSAVGEATRVEKNLNNGGHLELLSKEGFKGIRLSLLARDGTLPGRSGLNWGQREEYNREPNQAYIKVPVAVQRMDFFPKRGVHFIIEQKTIEKSLNIKDNSIGEHVDSIFFATRAQAKGKAIESTENNSILGKFFRYKIGIPFGDPITLDDLINYGKTYVDFFKIDDETFIMDF